MSDPICIVMGAIDIIAGGLIMFAFGIGTLPLIFGIIMIGKGAFSFI